MQKKLLLDSLKLSNECVTSYQSLDWSSIETYAEYLAQSYYYVNHSERLLALCIALLPNEDRKLQRRFITHLSEEGAHDQLLLHDLKNLGYHISDFPELSSTKNLWETQYYKVEHIDPAILLGYIYFLEDFACTVVPPINQKLTELYGKKCTTFLKLHAEEDPDHVEKARIYIESLNPHRQEEIIKNHLQSMKTFQSMIDEIRLVTQRENKQAA